MSGEWEVTIPAPVVWLNANDRTSWHQRAKLTRVWRDTAHTYAKVHRLPKLGAAYIIATLRFTDRRRRDGHNYYPTLKAVVDGLVDYGLIPDDSAKHLDGPDIRIGEPVMQVIRGLGYGQVVLTIRQVPG